MTQRVSTSAWLLLLAFVTAACGDTEAPTSPGANQAPSISISSSTAFGIAQLTTFTLTATASDPDGHPVAVTWTFSDGTTAAGTTVWRTLPVAATIDVVATVRDHLDATTTSNTVTIVVGTAAGDWSGTIDLSACEASTKTVTATLAQSGSAITGVIRFPEGLCETTGGVASIDGEDPGRIFAAGAVRLHAVAPPSIDVWFEGQVDATAMQISGTLQGTEPSGMPFALIRQ
jgi:hypothetical protein